MSWRRVLAVVVAASALAAGCAAPSDRSAQRVSDDPEQSEAHAAAAAGLARETAGQASTAGSTATATSSARQGGRRFWVKDKRRYRSPWYAGAHRKMINYGCTAAPYYSPDPRCTRRRGFHHGIDIAMPCGTRLFAGIRGRVVNPDSAGALGPAYGRNAFRIRNHRFDVDVVIGHTRRVFVRPGQRVRRGQRIALASDQGAPDGCHLHFEVRPKRGSVSDAVDPVPLLRLRVAG
jgi:murein DD-endopeptidase MepM/ murein hydrolase activator NlpD